MREKHPDPLNQKREPNRLAFFESGKGKYIVP